MTKELTDKMKEEMAEFQIYFIKENHPEMIVSSYELLKEYLAEGLKEYSQEKVSVNRKVDMKLLKSLQGNKRRGIAVRLINCVRGTIEDNDLFNEKDKDLMQLYEYNKEGKWIRNFGEETERLLTKYLTKKGLIE